VCEEFHEAFSRWKESQNPHPCRLRAAKDLCCEARQRWGTQRHPCLPWWFAGFLDGQKFVEFADSGVALASTREWAGLFQIPDFSLR
jgi:hypothetical protein